MGKIFCLGLRAKPVVRHEDESKIQHVGLWKFWKLIKRFLHHAGFYIFFYGGANFIQDPFRPYPKRYNVDYTTLLEEGQRQSQRIRRVGVTADESEHDKVGTAGSGRIWWQEHRQIRSKAQTQFTDDNFLYSTTVYRVHMIEGYIALPTWFLDLLPPMFLDFFFATLADVKRLIAQLILHFGGTCRTNCNPFGRSRRDKYLQLMKSKSLLWSTHTCTEKHIVKWVYFQHVNTLYIYYM